MGDNPVDFQGCLDSLKTPCGTDHQTSVHDSLRSSRKERDGSEIQETDQKSGKPEKKTAESIPFKFKSKSSNENFFTKWTDADGKVNKDDYLIFENGTQQDKELTQTIELIFKGAQTWL